ncbi:MAG TPA: Abi-alpha family protein [Jatrophihabitans sp.]|nr:Abi-alpha family protein [Jatrophihabitans sp.]
MAASREDPNAERPSPRPRSGQQPNGSLTRVGQPGTQVVSSAGAAIVTAARVGRLLGRAGWRIAKQLPGVALVEQQAQRLRHAAAAELLRLLEMPQQFVGTASPEEQRVMMLVQNANSDPAPLRTAMSELLSRAGDSSAGRSKEYLFGTIVSQLVPDEARILAALAGGKQFAVVDVVAKPVGRAARTILANASQLGTLASVAPARNSATYLTRLHALGLVEFGPAADELADNYEKLAVDSAVQDARVTIERNKMGSAKLIRKTVVLSSLGRDFWLACAPEGMSRTT